MPSVSSSAINRGWAFLLALVLGQAFVVSPIQQVWRDHWLVKDGQEGTAVIEKEHWAGHSVFVYQYRVGEKVYTGQDHRSRQNPKYAYVMPGEKSVVYYSSSHPWISAINLPSGVGIEGLPVVLLAWFFEAGFLITVINPRSRWAFDFSGQRRHLVEEGEGDSRDVDTINAERSLPLPESRSFLKDKLRLVGCGVLIVLTMAAIEVAINAIFGQK